MTSISTVLKEAFCFRVHVWRTPDVGDIQVTKVLVLVAQIRPWTRMYTRGKKVYSIDART